MGRTRAKNTTPPTLLWQAAAAGDAAAVERLLAEDDPALVDAAGANHETALMKAAAEGHDAIVTMLLAAGAAIDRMSRVRLTALGFAVRGGHIDVVNRLIQAGASVEGDDLNPHSLVTLAIGYKRWKILDLLLAANADINGRGRHGRWRSPLAMACSAKNSGAVQKLLAAGADVNRVDRNRESALQVATRIGSEPIIAMLVAAGADATQALANAVTRGDTQVVDQLLAAGASSTQALARAVTSGHSGFVNQLLAADADTSGALHCAVRDGNIEFVRMLLRAGANVNEVVRATETPLMIAVLRERTEILRELLSVRGVDLEHVDYYGNSALLTAIWVGTITATKMLWAAGANVYHTNRSGQTALMMIGAQLNYKFKHGFASVLHKLLALDAYVNQGDRQGRTALHHASSSANDYAVEALLSVGADVNCGDVDGDTPLICATQAGDSKTVEILIRAGANVNHVGGDRRGNTALFAAIDEGHHAIYEQLLAAGANVHHVNTRGETSLILLLSPRITWRNFPTADEFDRLLALGVNVDHVGRWGQSALHCASRSGNAYFVETLLSRGTFDIDSALLAAHTDVVDILLAWGADINYTGREGSTALRYAVDDTAKVTMLLEHGARVDEGSSALLRAAKHGNTPVVAKLLAHGANVNQVNREKRTALMVAVVYGKADVVEELVACGADVGAIDNRGASAKSLAAASKASKKVQIRQFLSQLDC